MLYYPDKFDNYISKDVLGKSWYEKGILQLWHSNFAIFRNTLINKYSSDWLNQIFAHRKKIRCKKMCQISSRDKSERDWNMTERIYWLNFKGNFAWTVFAVHRIFFWFICNWKWYWKLFISKIEEKILKIYKIENKKIK